MHASDYFTKLASMAGISAEDEQLKSILSNENLKNVEINDELATKINGAFLTVDSAKNNSELNKHFRAINLNGIDSELNNVMTEFEFDEALKQEINGENNSFKRVSLVAKKISALEKAKLNASKGDKDALQLEIDRLNGDVLEKNKTFEQQLADNNKQWESRFLDQNMTTILSGYNYAIPVSKSANILTAKTLLNEAINEKKLQITNNPNGGLKLVTSEGMDYYENNTVVSVTDFVDRVLTTNKLLVVSGGSTPPNPILPNGVTPPRTSGKYASEVDRMISEAGLT